jgi:pyrroline-5-carboxylate reductase
MDLGRSTIGILGAGNIGSAIARGIAAAGLVPPARIIMTRRNTDHLQEFQRAGFQVTADNLEAVRGSHLLIVAVTPQQLNALLAEIRPSVIPARHTVISVVSGATIAEIQSQLSPSVTVIRVMPNTAIAIRESMTCIATTNARKEELEAVKMLFNGLGKVVEIDEGLMVPATALCACGIAFFLRAIRAASQGGIEIGFHAEDALLMAAQTARGAASLLVAGGNHPEREVDKVTTPQGCTISGLNQMEHNGFSSALIKGIVTSAEKAAVLYAPKVG